MISHQSEKSPNKHSSHMVRYIRQHERCYTCTPTNLGSYKIHRYNTTRNGFFYCNWFLEFIRIGISVLDKIYFTDEAYFELTGYQNKQNTG